MKCISMILFHLKKVQYNLILTQVVGVMMRLTIKLGFYLSPAYVCTHTCAWFPFPKVSFQIQAFLHIYIVFPMEVPNTNASWVNHMLRNKLKWIHRYTPNKSGKFQIKFQNFYAQISATACLTITVTSLTLCLHYCNDKPYSSSDLHCRTS